MKDGGEREAHNTVATHMEEKKERGVFFTVSLCCIAISKSLSNIIINYNKMTNDKITECIKKVNKRAREKGVYLIEITTDLTQCVV